MNDSLTFRRATLLRGLNDRSNPFIEVTDSVRLLTRLGIALTLVFGWYVGLTSIESAPFAEIRLILLTITVAISTLPMWMKLPGVGILHPLYVMSAYTFLKGTVTGIAGNAVGMEQIPAVPSLGPQSAAWLQFEVTGLSILAMICTYFGFFSGRGIKWSFISFRDRREVLVTGGFIALIVGSASLYLLMDLSGGLLPHMKNITKGQTNKVWVKDADFASAYATLVSLLVIPAAFWTLIGKRPHLNPGYWGAVALAIVSAFLVNGRRSAVAMNIIIIAGCWVLATRKVAIGRLAIVWALLFLSIGVLGEYRRSNWTRDSRVRFDAFTDASLESAVELSIQEMSGRRGGASPIYPIVHRVPSQVPYKYGMNYVAYFNRFIPRILWPDKPRGIGIECAAIFYGRHNSGGVPPGELGEAYWAGGILGVVVVFFLWGRILCSIGTFFVKFHHSVLASLLYLITVTKLGPSETQFRAWLYLVAPATLMLMVIGVIKLFPRGTR